MCLVVFTYPAAAQVKSAAGKIAGVVNDTSGIPQLGATVELVPEVLTGTTPIDFLTNTQGVFRGDKLTPGLYTVRVTLAGFLPTLEQHVRVTAHLTTVVRIELESMFASLDQLRRNPSIGTVESDDWKWVLRSAAVTRPVLQWIEEDPGATSLDARSIRPKARLEFTDGARRPGSASNIPAAPATAFAYEQQLREAGRLLFAGQVNYLDSAPGGGIATVWLPTGSLSGARSTMVLREAKVGPDGQTFRGVRMAQSGTLGLGERSKLLYSGEYVMVGLGKAAASLRPRVELDTRLSEVWRAAMIFSEQSAATATPLEFDDLESGGALASTLNELDSFPALLWRAGHPELEGGWHEEIAAERKLGRGELQLAAFHDDSRHVAVYGRGSDLPSGDYLPDSFSSAFAYDGGSLNTWGARVAIREKLSEDLEMAAVYAFAGALTPSELGDGALRDMLRPSMHSSIGVNMTAKVPRSGTKVSVGYKWVSGVAVSRLDAFGDSLYQMDPYLHLGIRQTLPKFAPGHWQATANCDNVMAQGYVSLNTNDGRTVLVPAFRTFRGGLSVQF
jgi:hypothetical protein